MTEVLTSFCARLYGRRSARNRPKRPCARRRRCRRHDVEVTTSVRSPYLSSSFIPPLRVCGRAFASRPPTRTYYGSWAVISARSRRGPRSTLPRAQLSAKQRAQSRRERKRAITAASSSRWAGAITRTSEDSWQLAWRNLVAERRTLASRIHRIERRLTVPVGERRGFKTRQESTRSAGASSTSDELAGSNDASKTGESRSAGRIRLAKAVTISMLPASAKPPGGSGGRPSASSSAPTARPVSSSQPDGPLAPDEHWLELRLRSPRAPRQSSGGRYRLSCPSSSPTAVRRWRTGRERAVRYDVFFDRQAPLVSRRLVVVLRRRASPDMEHLRSGP